MNRTTRSKKERQPRQPTGLLANFINGVTKGPMPLKKSEMTKIETKKKAMEAQKRRIKDLPFHEKNLKNITLDLGDVTENILEEDYRRYLMDFTQKELDDAIASLKKKNIPLIPRDLAQERNRQRLYAFNKTKAQMERDQKDAVAEQLHMGFDQLLRDKGYKHGLPSNMDEIISQVDTTKKLVELKRQLDDLEKKEKKFIEEQKMEVEAEVVYVPKVLNEEEVREMGALPIHGDLTPRMIVKQKSKTKDVVLTPFPEDHEKRPLKEPELDDDEQYYQSLDTNDKRLYRMYKQYTHPPEKFDFDDPRGYEKFFLDKNDYNGMEIYGGDPDKYMNPQMKGERLFNAVLSNIPKGERMLMQYQASRLPREIRNKEYIRIRDHGPTAHDIYKWAKREELIVPLYSILAVRQHNTNLMKMIDDQQLSTSQRLDILSRFYQEEPELPKDLMVFYKILEPNLFNMNPARIQFEAADNHQVPHSENTQYDDITVISPATAQEYRNRIGEANMSLIRTALMEHMEHDPQFLKQMHQQIFRQHYHDMQKTLHGGIDPFNIPERLTRFRERQQQVEREILERRKAKIKRDRIKRSQMIFNLKFKRRDQQHEVQLNTTLNEIFDEQFVSSFLAKTKGKKRPNAIDIDDTESLAEIDKQIAQRRADQQTIKAIEAAAMEPPSKSSPTVKRYIDSIPSEYYKQQTENYFRRMDAAADPDGDDPIMVVENGRLVDRSKEVRRQEELMRHFNRRNMEMRRDHDRFKNELIYEEQHMTPDQRKAEQELQRLLFPKLFAPQTTTVKYPVKAVDPNTGEEYNTLQSAQRIRVDFIPFETHQQREHPRFVPITHDYMKDILANRLKQNKLEQEQSELKYLASELFTLEIDLYNQIVEDNNKYLDTLKEKQQHRIDKLRQLEEDRARGIDFIPVETFDPIQQQYQQIEEFERSREQIFKKPEPIDPNARPLPVSNAAEPVIDYDQFKLPALHDPHEIQSLRAQLMSRIEFGEFDLTPFHKNSNYDALIVKPLREKEREMQRELDQEREMALLPAAKAKRMRDRLQRRKQRPESMISKHAPKLSPIIYSVLKSMHDSNVLKEKADAIDELKRIKQASVQRSSRDIPYQHVNADAIAAMTVDSLTKLPPVASGVDSITSRALQNPSMLESALKDPTITPYMKQLHATVHRLRTHHLHDAVQKTRQYQVFQERQIEARIREEEHREYNELMKLYFDGEENPQRLIYDYIDGLLRYNPAAAVAAKFPTSPTKPTESSVKPVTLTSLGRIRRHGGDNDDDDDGEWNDDPDDIFTRRDAQRQLSPPPREDVDKPDAVTRFVMNFTNLSRLWWDRSQTPEAIHTAIAHEESRDKTSRRYYLDQLFFPKSSTEKQQLLETLARDTPQLFTLANPLVLDEICNNSGVFNHVARRELRALKQTILDVPIELDHQLASGEHLSFETMREYQATLWARRDKLLHSTSSVHLPTFLQYRLEQLRLLYNVPDTLKDRESTKGTAYLQLKEYQQRYYSKQFKKQQRAFRIYDYFYSSYSQQYKHLLTQAKAERLRQQQQQRTSPPQRSTTKDASLITLLTNSIIGTTATRLVNATRRALSLSELDSEIAPLAILHVKQPMASVFHNRRSPREQLQILQQSERLLDATTSVFSKLALSSSTSSSRSSSRPLSLGKRRLARHAELATNWLAYHQHQLQTRWKASATKFAHLLPYMMSQTQASTVLSSGLIPPTSTSTSIRHTGERDTLRQALVADLTSSTRYGDGDDHDDDNLLRRERLSHPFTTSLDDTPMITTTLFSSSSLPQTFRVPSFLSSHTITAVVEKHQAALRNAQHQIARRHQPRGLGVGPSQSILASNFQYTSTLDRKNAVIQHIRHFSTSVFPPSRQGPPPPPPPRRPPPPSSPTPPPSSGDPSDADRGVPDEDPDGGEHTQYTTDHTQRDRLTNQRRILHSYYQYRSKVRDAHKRQQEAFQESAKEETKSDFYYHPKRVEPVSADIRQQWERRRQSQRIYLADLRSLSRSARHGSPQWKLNLLYAYRSSLSIRSLAIKSRSYWLRQAHRLQQALRSWKRMDRFLTKGRRRGRRPRKSPTTVISTKDDGTNRSAKYAADLRNGMSLTMAAKRRHQREIRWQNNQDRKRYAKRDYVPPKKSRLKQMIADRDDANSKLEYFANKFGRERKAYFDGMGTRAVVPLSLFVS